mmetsp:Transcript_6953/g.8584  ORF Transcript_6953/g.8584 Transcript_6953/m.8584 type:complete len:2263 (-) Transcript_6953:99-6887(-)
MNSVMDDNKILTLINGDRIPLSNLMSLVFEVEDLAVASPATVSRAGMIFMDVENMGWEPHVHSWLQKRFSDSDEILAFHKDLFQKYVKPILDFKQASCIEPVPIADFSAVTSLLSLYDILAGQPLNTKAQEEGPTATQDFCKIAEKKFIFCVVWTIMAGVDEKGRASLNLFLRDIDSIFPPMQTVYDYYLDPQKSEFELWDTKTTATWIPPKMASFHQFIVPTSDSIRNSFIVSSLIKSKKEVLLTGNTGIGKSTLFHALLDKLPDNRSSLTINFSSATSSNTTQSVIEGVMEKVSKDKIGPTGGKYLLIFIDDFNMPRKTSAESPFQPPLELLRLWLDYGGWYDREKCVWRNVIDSQLCAAMSPPSGGREVISNRTQSRFCQLHCTDPNDSQVIRIFQTILSSKLKNFDSEIKSMSEPLAKATLSIYKQTSSSFFPTPSKFHYLFNLRDISKVVQGVLQAENHLHTKDSFLRLWVHECMRSFSDRFQQDGAADEAKFVRMLSKILQEQFHEEWASLMENSVSLEQGPIFSSILKPDTGSYEEISNFGPLQSYMLEMLEDYNSEANFIPMNLILFKDALRHVCRIHRVLQQNRGNIMLIGVGGSGRRSLTFLSSYVSQIDVFTIEITKQYRSLEFREDIKQLYTLCGMEDKPTVFLLSDSQIKEESFLEDVNNILSSGEVPNLFSKEDFVNIYDAIRMDVIAAGLDEAPAIMWKFFIDRVRANMHIVLAMSPIGDSTAKRCRTFPSLVNCTTIDFFNTWPVDALQEVAVKKLQKLNFSDQSFGPKVSKMFADVHLSVVDASRQMEQELQRHNYVTPTTYLEFVEGYIKIMSEKESELGAQKKKLVNGLKKLEESKKQVECMSVELVKKKGIVAISQKKCEEMMVVIVTERTAAEERRKIVESDSKRIAKEEKECLAIAEDAEADLAIALPALQKALQAVDNLDKGAISEIKAYNKPPPAVEKVMSCIMIILGKPTDWSSAKKTLGESSFLSSLKFYDKDNVKDLIITKVKKFVKESSFAVDEVKKVSTAAGALCCWCHAIYVYSGVAKDVAPKRAKLKNAQEGLAVKQAALAKSKDALAEVVAKVEQLKERYDSSVAEKNDLQQEAANLEDKLVRAEKLINGLEGEYKRWTSSVGLYENSITNLVGDCLLSSGFLSYSGPFDTKYRENLIIFWETLVKKMELPYTENLSVAQFLSKAIDVRDWNIQGLPRDNFSTENGVIVKRSSRWPLMIDPQGQANKWIRNMEGKQLIIIDLKMKDFLRDVENAIVYGKPVLLQDILEDLDPSLEPILNKSISKVGNRCSIKLGDKELDYCDTFCLYITTKLGNPHYTPEVSSKTTVVNFAVKQEGLEEQLLGIVVNLELPELEKQKSDLTVRVANGKRKLVELEDVILKLLAESKGSLLDDLGLINTLQVSKTTAEEVKYQLIAAQETENNIDETRNGYRPAAIRSTIAYLVVNDMANIDPMYQFSLDTYIELFRKSIEESRTTNKLTVLERVIEINNHHTFNVYESTCVGLFERHKILFSFQLCFKILEKDGSVNKEEFDFFCRGGVVADRANQQPAPAWLNPETWDNVSELNSITSFDGLALSIQSDSEWKGWVLNNKPEETTLPADWDEKLDALQKMCIIRALRPDRVIFAASIFVAKNIGSKYANPTPFRLIDTFKKTSSKTPLIFVLSPGVDPTVQVCHLAAELDQRVVQIALGQGQAPMAVQAIEVGLKNGSWVFLANCHLMLSWMSDLEKIVENYCENGKVHDKFRLWLSSSPNDAFPLTLLQRGIKMTTEPPSGLRSNIIKLYNSVSEEKFSECGQQAKYKKLVFALIWFHSILLERRKFKALGFNIPYEFNESDFQISHDLIIMLLDEYPSNTPLEAMRYLIGEANYGGRVTDDWDRRLVNVYMNQYLCTEIIDNADFRLSEIETYCVPNPEDGNLVSYKESVQRFPTSDHPAAFGQHPNADISSQREESYELLGSIISLQPRNAVEAGETREELLKKQMNTLHKLIPSVFNVKDVKSIMMRREDPDALKTVLYQEIERYNILLARIQETISQLQKAVSGVVVFTQELEETSRSILQNKVPQVWGKSYPSTKPLRAWMRDLGQRVEQFRNWVEDKMPPVFRLSTFTYPTGFLTGVLQTSARKNGVAIDALSWEFSVVKEEPDDIIEGPTEGVYVMGMQLEGAKWDAIKSCLSEPPIMELVSPMPVMHFKPVEGRRKMPRGIYICPLYMYPIRTGTRERPSYVISVELNSGTQSSDHWTKRGTALLLSSDS